MNTEIALSDVYRSIAAPATGVYKASGSKFIAFAFPVETEDEVKSHIATLKKEYFDARHHCFAYRLGHDGAIWRASDDGEPAGTAGRPILGQLLSADVSDVLVVVVRYFGGVKLGVPGLIKAYKTSTADALTAAGTVEKISCENCTVKFDYLRMNDVMKIVKDTGAQILSQSFDNTCQLSVRVRLTKVNQLMESLDFAEVEKS